MANKDQKNARQPARRDKRLTLHPLTLEEALRGAMETGRPPEKLKHAKRTAGKAPRNAKSKAQ